MLTLLWRAPAIGLLRVRGIRVEAHSSVVIPVLIYTGFLGSSRFLGRYPGLPAETITAMTIASVLLIFVSVLLHELGHSFRALREGLTAERITLWGLGGVAWIGTPTLPGVAFRVTAAGPLVSAVLAVLLGAAGWLGRRLGLPDAVVGVTVLLAQANAVMFAFNLLPIFPLDGGRILHSALWYRCGLAFAWVWALRVGTGVAASVLAVGVVGPFLGLVAPQSGINVGWWLMLEGAILLWWSQRLRLPARPLRAGRRAPVVADLLEAAATPSIPGPETTIADFLEQSPRGRGYGTCASNVLESGRPVGFISPGLAGQVPAEQRAATTVADVMVRRQDAVVLQRETTLEEALRALQDGPRRGVVVDGRRVMAIILAADLADVLLRARDVARGVATGAPVSPAS